MPEVGLPKNPGSGVQVSADSSSKVTVSEMEQKMSSLSDLMTKSQIEDESDKITVTEDKIFDEIKDKILRTLERSSSTTSLQSTASSLGDNTVKTAENFQIINHGFQPRASYEQSKKLTDIMGVTFNSRQKQFVILDAKGITVWKKDAAGAQVSRAMNYPKYEYRLITYLVYAKKYNVYFGLGKDFTLKVLNRDFDEVCSVNANLRSVLFMLFNPVRDELITGGVGGTKVWRYYQVAEQSWKEIKPMANYKLGLKYELKNVGGSWVKRVDLDPILQHLYCCSEMDLFAYDLEGNLLYKFIGAHSLSITGCVFSMAAKLLVTSSMDAEVKVWSVPGGHVHTFRGHSRAVTNLVLHPDTTAMFLTSSLDGSVRMWSLDTMDCLYNVVVSSDGVVWMGVTDDKLLYVSTVRNITMWSLNYITQFWALTRNTVCDISLVGAVGKTTRVMTLGEDSSVRLFARGSHKNLATVLPPPSISPLQRVLSFSYSRKLNIVYILINLHEVWLYTTRTDPACRIAVWDIHELQEDYLRASSSPVPGEGQDGKTPLKAKKFRSSGVRSVHNYRATESGIGNEEVADCCSIAVLDTAVMMWTDEGFCSPLDDHFLLLGLEDGRILFMDPVVKGHKHMEFKASKDRIKSMTIDKTHHCLTTLSQLKEVALIQIWSLPELQLQFEVFCQMDVISMARIDDCLLTGHTSGAVNYHGMVPADDPGPLRPKATVPVVDPIPTDLLKTEHKAPAIGLDSCPNMGVFCSCSTDGSVKVWIDRKHGKVLLTEIMLDDELSAACFFNEKADLLLGYKNHLFLIDGSKIVPGVEIEELSDDLDKESDIYEDPAVAFEGVQEHPDPVDLDNYLVPYNMEFSEDFLIGKKPLIEKVKEESEDEEEGSELSWAPTEIYFSPEETPRERSMIDLTLTPDVSRYDLQEQMKTTKKLEGRRRRRPEEQSVSFADISLDLKEKDKKEVRPQITGFEFPEFGTSPGPTPSITPLSTPTVGSPEASSLESEEESTDVEGGRPESESHKEKEKEKKKSPKKEKEQEEQKQPDVTIEAVTSTVTRVKTAIPAGVKSPQIVKKPAVAATGTPEPSKSPADTSRPSTSMKSRMDNVGVDIKALMAEAREERKREQQQKIADQIHVRMAATGGVGEVLARGPGLTVTQALVPQKPVKKKEAVKDRRMPRRASRPSVSKLHTVKSGERKKSLHAEPSKIMRPKVPADAAPTESDGETEDWSSEDDEIRRITGEVDDAGEPRKSSGVRRKSAKGRTKPPSVHYDGPVIESGSAKPGVSGTEHARVKSASASGRRSVTVDAEGRSVMIDEEGRAFVVDADGTFSAASFEGMETETMSADGKLQVVIQTQANIMPKKRPQSGGVHLGIEPTCMLDMGVGASAFYRAAKMAWVQRTYGSKAGEKRPPKGEKKEPTEEEEDKEEEVEKQKLYGHVTSISTSTRRQKPKSADMSRGRAGSALTMDTDLFIEERDEIDLTDDEDVMVWETDVAPDQRPSTSLARYRPVSGFDAIPRKPRPFTALVTNKEKDIYGMMEELFSKYQQSGYFEKCNISPYGSTEILMD